MLTNFSHQADLSTTNKTVDALTVDQRANDEQPAFIGEKTQSRRDATTPVLGWKAFHGRVNLFVISKSRWQ